MKRAPNPDSPAVGKLPPPAPPPTLGQALDVLANVSGMKKEEVQRAFDEAKENVRKLRSCEGPHDFEKVNDGLYLRAQYRCKKCGGLVRGHDYHWYEEGLKHGKASR